MRNLGVIEELTIVLGPGMTALTGETGAGKTLIVEAIDLLVGGRADSVLVRPGSDEASGRAASCAPTEARSSWRESFPPRGRSRGTWTGGWPPSPPSPRPGPDSSTCTASMPTSPSSTPPCNGPPSTGSPPWSPSSRHRRPPAVSSATSTTALAALGGDARARAREMDLLRFQVAELDGASLEDPDEESGLARQEDALADATAHRGTAALPTTRPSMVEAGAGEAGSAQSIAGLSGEGSVRGLGGPPPWPQRPRSTTSPPSSAKLAELLADDPDRLAQVQARRQLLRDLRRKYGDSLADVFAYRRGGPPKLADLSSFEVARRRPRPAAP